MEMLTSEDEKKHIFNFTYKHFSKSLVYSSNLMKMNPTLGIEIQELTISPTKIVTTYFLLPSEFQHDISLIEAKIWGL